MIKYLGSKRALLPAISKLIAATGANTGVDLFTGTTRIAREMKTLGIETAAVDTASYSEVFSKTWIELDAETVDQRELESAIDYLNQLKGTPGYFTDTFCQQARFFQPKNGERIDAIRDEIETEFLGSSLYYPLLTSLIMAADKVDSTTGVQMAYLKTWSHRSGNDIELKNPDLLHGSGRSIRADANESVEEIGPVDLAYLDPPYNQHRYFSNYHIWETLVRWDEPDSYGIAKKRLDVKLESNKSDFNSKLTMAPKLRDLITRLSAKTLILSYNNESWLSRRDLADMCEKYEVVKILDFDAKRYVGSQIGVYNHSGELVGKPGAKTNLEHLVVAGEGNQVSKMLKALTS